MSRMQITRVVRLLFTSFITTVFLMGCTPALTPTGPKNVAPPTYSAQVPSTPTAQPELRIKIAPTPIHDYLTNPGIGWQDNSDRLETTDIPETVAYSNRQLIAWARLNPAEGVYDWSALDEQLNAAIHEGKQFSFRIYTYAGEPYGRSMIPSWVLHKGGLLLSSGAPDYSNCAYQEAWGQFVAELARVYDGNPNIAFIDISGYGNFNEWNWLDAQTKWDEQWRLDYQNGTPSPQSFQTLDGQARRRLADMFIGGSFTGHACKTASGEIVRVNYDYQGFQHTQLLMPYAGIVQSSQYVYSRRHDIGFRYDCLGRDGQALMEKMGDQINKIWKHAPVVYELCNADQSDINDIQWLLPVSHPSLIHNNQWRYSRSQLMEMILNVGYRYLLQSADLKDHGHQVDLNMQWQNIGLAPSYPKMGQIFNLYFYLLDASDKPVFRDLIPVDTSLWLPAGNAQQVAPNYGVTYRTELPASVANGTYQVGIAILDARTEQPIYLSFDGRSESGIYILSSINIQ